MKKQSSHAAIRSHFSRQAATYDSQAIAQNLTRAELINLTIPWLFNHFRSLQVQNKPLRLKFADLGAGSNLNFTRELWERFLQIGTQPPLDSTHPMTSNQKELQWENLRSSIASYASTQNLTTQNQVVLSNLRNFFIKGEMVDLVNLQDTTTQLEAELKTHCKGIELQAQNTSLEQWSTVQQHDFDLIFSSACLQWLPNPQDFLHSLKHKVLAQQGTVICSTFSVDNLLELRVLGLPGLDYHTPQQWLAMLEAVGFQVDVLSHSHITLYFPTLKELFRHLKETGVNGIESGFKWTKQSYQEFLTKFHEQFYVAGQGYPLTYHPVIFVANA